MKISVVMTPRKNTDREYAEKRKQYIEDDLQFYPEDQ